jgi:hypothetical protein
MGETIKRLLCFHKWVELPQLIKFQKYYFVANECKKCKQTKVKFN